MIRELRSNGYGFNEFAILEWKIAVDRSFGPLNGHFNGSSLTRLMFATHLILGIFYKIAAEPSDSAGWQCAANGDLVVKMKLCRASLVICIEP